MLFRSVVCFHSPLSGGGGGMKIENSGGLQRAWLVLIKKPILKTDDILSNGKITKSLTNVFSEKLPVTITFGLKYFSNEQFQ